MDFCSSTHRRHWMFTEDVLRGVQEETARLSAEACAAGTVLEGSRSFAVTRSTAEPPPVFKTKKEITAKAEGGNGDNAGACPGEGDGGEGRKRPAPGLEPILTVEEEGLVKSFYAKKIQETCGRNSADEDLRRSDKVQATAVAYFQRFYLSNSVLEHDPKLLSLTSVFLASKTEEQITNVNNLAKATGLDDLQILGKELTLLQGLSFHLAVFHPYRALPALVDGAWLKARAAGVRPQKDRIEALQDGARATLDDVLVTDLPFLHPPSRLALAALLREGRQMEAPPFDVALMLGKEFGDRKGWKGVLEQANRLAQDMDSFVPYRVEKEKLIAVNKKLKKHALWSVKRGGGSAEGRRDRRKSKKIKTEA